MDTSVPEQGSSTPRDTKVYWVILSTLGNILKWLASIMRLTETEQEEAGIHIERVDGE